MLQLVEKVLGLCYSFQFLGFNSKTIPLHKFRRYPTFTFIGFESFSMLHLITGLLLFMGVALGLLAKGESPGLKRYDLLVKGLVMAWHCMMYSIIYFFKMGKVSLLYTKDCIWISECSYLF